MIENEFVIVAIVFGVMAILYFALSRLSFMQDSNATKTGIPPCPPHRWDLVPIKDEYQQIVWVMICSKCNKTPEV